MGRRMARGDEVIEFIVVVLSKDGRWCVRSDWRGPLITMTEQITAKPASSSSRVQWVR